MVCIGLWIALAGKAQSLIITDSVCTQLPITNYSIDTKGNIYLALEGGQITKYSPTLDSLQTYAPQQTGSVSLLEAGNGFYLFAFYDFFQEYLLLNRFLSNPTRTSLAPVGTTYIDLATQSQDNSLWLIENGGLRLLKYNPIYKTIEVETPLNTILAHTNNHFTYIKEYQNRLYLLDPESGIYVFDNLGNYVKTINIRTQKISFYKEQVVYVQELKLVLQHLYSEHLATLDLPKPIDGALMYRKNSYLLSSTCVFKAQ